MSEEIKNTEKRKNASLTINEWLGFFFIPINPSTRILPTKDFNEHEEDRFKKFGFDKKLSQSGSARLLGVVFYIVLIGIIIKILN